MPELFIAGFEDVGLEPQDIARLVECLPGSAIQSLERGKRPEEHAPGTTYAARLESAPDGRVSIKIYGPLSGADSASAAASLAAFLSRAVARAYATATSQNGWNKSQHKYWNDLVFTALHAPLADQDQDWNSAFKTALTGTRGLSGDTADQAVRVMDQHFQAMDDAAEPNYFVRNYQAALEDLDRAVRRHALRRTLEDRIADPGVRALGLRSVESLGDDGVQVKVSGETESVQPVIVHADSLAEALQSAVRSGSPASTLRQVGQSAYDLNQAWQSLSTDERTALKPGLIRSLRFTCPNCSTE